MADLYHIFITPNPGVTREKVEEVLNNAVHWFRYRDGCYVVETTSDENTWYSRLASLVKPKGYMFICRLDPNHYHGLMTKEFWTWFEARK